VYLDLHTQIILCVLSVYQSANKGICTRKIFTVQQTTWVWLTLHCITSHTVTVGYKTHSAIHIVPTYTFILRTYFLVSILVYLGNLKVAILFRFYFRLITADVSIFQVSPRLYRSEHVADT
jgi:hypothetical protein